MAILDLKKQIQIVDYAEHLGFTVKRVGNWFTLKEHDSVRIDPMRNLFYRNSTGQGGSIIDFVMAFRDKDLSGAIEELSEYTKAKGLEEKSANDAVLASFISDDLHKRDAKTKLILPQPDATYKNVYAYLCKTRCISRVVVDWMVERGWLYQDIHKNCVFRSYKDGLPVFASIRGTNTFKKFVADASGSDYAWGLFFPQPFPVVKRKIKTLCIFESAIDMMSYLTLKINSGEDAKEVLSYADFLVISGVSKKEAVYNQIQRCGYRNIELLLDNDDAGRAASEELEDKIIKMDSVASVIKNTSKEKDWNEELVKNIKEKSRKATGEYKQNIL